MARFCVKCGSRLEPDARFCDECGAPVRTATRAQTAQPARATPCPAPAAAAAVPLDINWRRAGLWSGVGVAVLVVVGGVAAFLAMPPSTPSTTDLGGLVNADKAKVVEATCLGNFAYEKSPVVVGAFDVNTQQWMQVLTQAGIYGPPQAVTNAFLLGGGQQYSHTALGEKKIHDGKLCFADGLTVSTVQFAKPVKIGKQWHTQGSYTYTYRNADTWIQSPEAQRAVPQRFANMPKTAYVSLVKSEHGWQFDNGMAANDGLALANAMRERMDATPEVHGGLFSSIADAVSAMFRSRPALVGKWRDDEGLGDAIEFTHDSAIMNGRPTPVTFETDHKDDKRIYLMRAGARIGTVELIDNDHLEISFGFGTARFHRAG